MTKVLLNIQCLAQHLVHNRCSTNHSDYHYFKIIITKIKKRGHDHLGPSNLKPPGPHTHGIGFPYSPPSTYLFLSSASC